MTLRMPNLCVFHRELIGLSRQRKLLFARLLMLVPGAWVLVGFSFERWRDAAIQGRDGFNLLIRLEVAAIGIVIPLLTAAIIAEELEQNTLQLLLLTRQAPGKVLLQKLMSRIIATLILLLLPLPLLITLTSTGGVSFDMLISGLLTLLLAFEICLLGSLMASWFTRTVAAAYLLSYVAIAAMWFFLVEYWGLRSGRGWGVLITAAIGLLILPLCCLITFRRMTTVAMRPARTPLWVSLYNRYSRAMRRLRTWGQTVVADVSLDAQPMLWREYHQRFYATNSFILRLFAMLTILVMALLLLWGVHIIFGDYYFGSRIGYLMEDICEELIVPALLWLSALVPLVLGISVITREESCHSLDLLRVTTLSDDAIFGAKLWLVFKVSLLLALLFLATQLPQLIETSYSYHYYFIYSTHYGQPPRRILSTALLFPSLILLIAGTAMHSAMLRQRFLPALLQAIALLGLLAGSCVLLWTELVAQYGVTGDRLFNGFIAILGAFAVWKLARKLLAIRGIIVVKVICCLCGGVGISHFLSLLAEPPPYYYGPEFEPALAAWSLAHLMLWLAWRQTSSWRCPA